MASGSACPTNLLSDIRDHKFATADGAAGMRATQMGGAARPNERERMSQSVVWSDTIIRRWKLGARSKERQSHYRTMDDGTTGRCEGCGIRHFRVTTGRIPDS